MRSHFRLNALGVLALLLSGLGAPALAASSPALAAPCADLKQNGRSYTICQFDPKADDLRLFWRAPDGEPLGSFEAAAATLKDGEKLVFAMNAGMYDPNYAPVGLYVEKGVELRRANLRGGAGNFHLKPNGVFFIGAGQAGVMETAHFLSSRPAVNFATQSGPMLVLNGKIHPRIHADGTSTKTRNGVGIDREGLAVFAISNEPVTFFEFASLFRDALHCDNALFLDGSISALYAPNLGRNDFTLPMGPMVGAVRKGR
ncbi:MAG: phosphodiester glycosidase family protein [Anaerolineaceae bacterium]|nr:phosphodiester glycosidase family protein [Anaerolineaceae bacterium]